MSQPQQSAGSPALRLVVALGALSVVAGVLLVLSWSAPGPAPTGPDEAPAPLAAAEADAPAAPAEDLLVLVTTEGEIEAGQTLAGTLDGYGIPLRVAHVIQTEMSPVFNFRYARPGDRFVLQQDEDGELVSFHYERSLLEQYELRRGDADEGWVAERQEPELVRKSARVAGVVETSLYDAITALGENVELAHDFANIFAWDVDFSRAVRSGDEFAILYERLHARDDDGELAYVGPGRILAARYSNALQDYTAVYYETDEGRGGYYRPDGSSVQRQFLKAPLNYSRISSRYTMSRLHPILKVRRPHQGIDYAAAHGTPVWSVGNGKVIFRGWSGGFGKLVKVRHANGYVSYYGHLSRFASDLGVGDTVAQKQVLGYVGCTGLCTGPHLDFRFKHNGHYVNPAGVQTPAGDPIPLEKKGDFAGLRDQRLQQLDPAPLTVVTTEAL